MPQSAKILTTACPKPAVPFEDCSREYGRVTRSASPQRSGYTGPSSFPPSCTVQRRGFSIGSRSGYWSGFTNAACAPSLASNGKIACRTKKSTREQACPTWSPSCFRCSKNGRRTHAQNSLHQRAPRTKARSWCSKKALQRSAEETACTGGNQLSVTAAEGLRPRQLALITEKCQL